MAVDDPPGGPAPSSSATTLQDDGIVLRPLAPVDAEPWHAGEDEVIRTWFQFPRASTLQDVRDAIDAWMRSWSDGGPTHHFGIRRMNDDVLVGGVEVRDRGEGAGYLSYLVFASHRRLGYASRAVRLVVAHALAEMSVQRLVIITDEDNAASRGVAEAAGFRFDGPADPWEHIEIGTMVRYVHP